MTHEPEPQDRNRVDLPPYSIEDRLKDFRASLDRQPPKKEALITLPGFLFRNGKDTLAYGWQLQGGMDASLLQRHILTYQRGLEAREQLLARIKPVEILEMVRSVWGKGEMKQTEEGGVLTYSYMKVEEKMAHGQHSHTSYSAINGETTSTTSFSYKTGQWCLRSLQVEQELAVSFGNEVFNRPEDLVTEELNAYFADWYREGVRMREVWGLPKTIWRRPDNLGVSVTVPYMLEPGQSKYYLQGYYRRNAEGYPTLHADKMNYIWELFKTKRYAGQNSTDLRLKEIAEDEELRKLSHPSIWFNQSASQQEILDYLAQRLEAQRKLGQLPSQLKELELAKIGELRKRNLLDEAIYPAIYSSDTKYRHTFYHD